MATTIISKNSSTSGVVPTTSDLALGEIGINTYDGKMFIKKDDGTAAVVEVSTGVIDNLTSTSTTDALSANMGKTLQDSKANLTGDNTINFKVADGVASDDAVSKGQLDTALSGSVGDADTLDGYDSTDFVLVTDYEDTDVLTKIKNVDGSGSGLDADLLDGHDSTYFISDSDANSQFVAVAGDTMTGKLTLDSDPTANLHAATKQYVDGIVNSSMKSPDGYATTAGGDYPTDYKSSGTVSEGDTFYITDITNGTTVGAETVNVGDYLVALVDNPGNTDSNWIIMESNRDQATTTVKGVARIATQTEVDSGTDTETFVTPATLHSATSLNSEAVQDIVGDMVASNTETGITVTYDDTNGKLDFVVPSASETVQGISEIATQTEVDAGTDDTRYITPAKLAATTNLNSEAVEDIVGAMVSGNTENGIDVTYDDTNGKLDFDINTINGGTF